MSNCGCSGICSCEFANGETTIAEGNGRIATPFAVHLNDIPYKRPVGMLARDSGGDQAIAGGVTTQVVFTTNLLTDANGNFDADTMGTTVTELTVPAGGAGIYLVGGFVEWAITAAVATTKSFWMARNGSVDVLTRGILASTNTFGASNRCYLQSISGLVSLAVGDIIRAYVLTGEATSLLLIDANTSAHNCWPYMYAQYMGAAS